MSDDIVERLRKRSENWEIDCKFDPSCDDAQMDRQAADEIERLREEVKRMQYNLLLGPPTDENERLRSLITAWADACDLMMKVGTLDTNTPEGIAAGNALLALRKAVGR